MRTDSRRSGFTLIELLIVLVILGILATFALNFVWKAKDRSLVTGMQSDLRTAAAQQEIYFERNGRYAALPSEIPGFAATPGVTLTINYAERNGWAGVTNHIGIPAQTCGLLIGEAPAGSAGPAVNPGVIACT